MFQPIIKWSGSKRTQSSEIVSHFPSKIGTYYEPFCGGASVMRCLLESDIVVDKVVCSDINPELIGIWKMVKDEPNRLLDSYTDIWSEMNLTGKNEKEKEDYYNGIRGVFNATRSLTDFFFLNRTSFNGLVRYNSKGEFNAPYHIGRPGISPLKLSKLMFEWHSLLNSNDVEFRLCGYDEIVPDKADFVYLDPPYPSTVGMYYGNFDKVAFFGLLGKLPCQYALSYDGMSGNDDNTYDVPRSLYDEHLYLKSGVSSFKRIVTDKRKDMVYDSLYIKFNE